jgi:hypothetical protein
MTKPRGNRNPRNLVILTAFNESGEIVLRQQLSYLDYYEELHPIIDEDGFRAERNIRALKGKIYNYAGKLVQEFRVDYDENGKYIDSHVVDDY